ncbi:hypothetical protein B0F90DRAFT_1721408 [Multifurca ochricompacta]|uniref:Pyridoxal phosphate homeostasis protein n=1 Tax=Multifurca ochricompacta TaxID=376703 RepID=A0AAD4M5B1_9AGAM|nr:hypothetical protein B0F90DRAFT_1721408 [Multifurca ochricompacta]
MRAVALCFRFIHNHRIRYIHAKSMSTTSPSTPLLSPERIKELQTSLAEIRARVNAAASAPTNTTTPSDPLRGGSPTLVAVSKYKPAEDISACYDVGQRDFGENYVQELVEKAALLPIDLRWHFIGTVQSNKAKALAGIENLFAVQTLSSIKVADSLNRHRAAEHAPIRVFIQVNTSEEEVKGGISADDGDDGILVLAKHVIDRCPNLRLVGLMTIGAPGNGRVDFEVLRRERDRLVSALPDDGMWGMEMVEEGEVEDSAEGDLGRRRRRFKLLLSMGMSDDFELALRSGADIVRVGTGIFGARPPKKGEILHS